MTKATAKNKRFRPKLAQKAQSQAPQNLSPLRLGFVCLLPTVGLTYECPVGTQLVLSWCLVGTYGAAMAALWAVLAAQRAVRV